MIDLIFSALGLGDREHMHGRGELSAGDGARQPGCKFCDVLADATEGWIVLEDEHSLAFLDHRPLFPGHSLLVPREHYETLPDLPEKILTELFLNAQVLARAMELGLGGE